MLRGVCQAVNQAPHVARVISPCSATCGRVGIPGVGSCLPLGNVEQRRNTIVVKRMYPPRLPKQGHRPRVRSMQKILQMVDVEHAHPKPDIQCILTDDVEGVGNRGDLLYVKRRLFRNYLYPAGFAKYASPENIAEWKQLRQESGEERETAVESVYAKMTAKKLFGMFLPVPMSGDNPWILNKTHVKVAFRRMYVELTEDCIELPDEEITEPRDLEIKVTINGTLTVPVKARIYHIFKDQSKNVPPDLPPLFTYVDALPS
ncbi:large ribosomal subunit protein bL9m-like [Liolophura sinensis]|uniref:large ribosomal subunit protein bL9m-like n=1 Tax=Liolophura sinensis TaxID=3198878 RepID=UPI003158FEDD